MSKKRRTWVCLATPFLALYLTGGISSGQSPATPSSGRGFKPQSPPAKSVAGLGSYYALVIGINDYRFLPHLKTAINDANAIAALLRGQYGFKVRVLSNPTRYDILSALNDYRGTLPANSSLLIYYAGHGYYDTATDKAYWLPVDAELHNNANWIIADDITSEARALPALHVLIVSDSCYSGQLTREGNAGIDPRERTAYIQKMLKGKSRTLMSSGGNEPVADGGGAGHSVFADALLSGLGRIDQDVYTAGDLFNRFIQPRVAGRSDQVPQYSLIRNSGHESGDFVFDRTKAGLGAAESAAKMPPDDTGAAPSGEIGRSNAAGQNEAAALAGTGVGGIRRSIAVLGFKNISARPDTAWMSEALSAAMRSELDAGGELRIIPEENIARMKVDLSVDDADSLAADSLARIRRALGCDLVVLGSYLAQSSEPGASIRLDVRLQDAVSGEIVDSQGETGGVERLYEVAERGGEAFRQRLGVGVVAAAEAAAVEAALPSNPEAARWYSEGLLKLRAFDALGARDLLEKAAAADANYSMTHAALAETWQLLGYDAKAQAEAKFALDLSFPLIPEQRSSIKGSSEEIGSDWDAAIETYKSLWNVFGDNIEYGLLLARAQTSAGKGNDALATLSSLRKLPPPSGQDPRIDLAAAYADNSISSFQQGADEAAQAARKATEQGSRNLVAQALLEQCWALGNLSEAAQATQACEKAQEAFADVGDLLGRARSLTRLSNIATAEGNVSQALDLRTRALSIAKQIGSKKDISGALINIGNLQSDSGNLEAAQKSYQGALDVAREIDFKKDVLDAENGLGTSFQSLCDFEKAKDSYEQSRQAAQAIGDKSGMAKAVYNLGSVLFVLGDLAIAQSQVQQAITLGQEVGLKSEVASWLLTLGDILMAQDDLAGAEKSYQEARALTAEDEKSGLATNRLEWAGLDLEKGQPAEAEILARQAADEFQTEKDADNETGAREMLARALMAQGKFPAAAQEVSAAEELGAHDCSIRLPLAITKARLQAHTQQVAAARQVLGGVLSETKARKLEGYEMEARLAQAEVEILSGDEQSGRPHLKALQNDATVWRFMLIARKAGVLGQAGTPGTVADR